MGGGELGQYADLRGGGKVDENYNCSCQGNLSVLVDYMKVCFLILGYQISEEVSTSGSGYFLGQQTPMRNAEKFG